MQISLAVVACLRLEASATNLKVVEQNSQIYKICAGLRVLQTFALFLLERIVNFDVHGLGVLVFLHLEASATNLKVVEQISQICKICAGLLVLQTFVLFLLERIVDFDVQGLGVLVFLHLEASATNLKVVEQISQICKIGAVLLVLQTFALFSMERIVTFDVHGL